MERPSALVKATALLRPAWSATRRLGSLVLDQIYPPACPVCASPISGAEGLCPACWRQLMPITAPLCPVLGLPFVVGIGPEAVSAEAIADPPPFRRARSAVVYNDIARSLVAALKYADRPELARLCARLMSLAGRELLADHPVLLPVPLHRSRQWRRRYNQSGELARAVAGPLGLAVDPALVRRIKATPQQVGLSRAGRDRNMSGAFAAHPDVVARVAGRPVLIVDDVITTGSTVKAVTRALNRAGVDAVDVLSFARVVIAAELPI
jgi:ComF family protein